MASAFTLFGELRADTTSFKNSLRDAQMRLESVKGSIDSVERRAESLGKTTAVSARSFDKLRESANAANQRLVATSQAFIKGDASAAQMRSAIVAAETASLRLNSRLADTSARLTDMGKRAVNVQSILQGLSSGMQSVGTALTATVTAPLVALGAIATKSAVGFDTLRTQLTAATGDTNSANKKFAELNKLAQENAGVLTSGAVATYNFLKPMGFAEGTINEVIKAFGKLKAANPEVDLQRMATNLGQLFDQGFEQQDVKELVGNFPRALEILRKAFNLKSTDRKGIGEELKGLMAAGLTREQFFAAFAGGINADQFLSRVADPIAVRFEKLKERILLALEPLGLVIVGALERITPYVLQFVQYLSSAFTSLSPVMQAVAVAFGAVAAVMGPILIALAPIVAGFAQLIGYVGGFGAIAAVIGTIGLVIAGLAIQLAPAIALGALFYNAWASNWELIKQVFWSGVETVKSVVASLVATLEGLWTQHGEAIMTWASLWWTTFSNVISAAMDVVANYLKLALQVIQGDWAGAWQTVLDITAQVWSALAQLVSSGIAVTHKFLQAALPILVQAFVWVGSKILEVVTKAVALVIDVFLNLPSYLIALIPKLISAGAQIGQAIWNGIKQGLSGGLLGGGGGLNVGGSIGGSTPFGDLVNQFKSLFSGGGLTAGLGGSVALNAPTFLTPVLSDAIKTTNALKGVKKAADSVKQATSSATATAKVNLMTTREARIGNNIVSVTDTILRNKDESFAEASARALREVFRESTQPNALRIEIADPNGRTAGATTATPQTTNVRYSR